MRTIIGFVVIFFVLSALAPKSHAGSLRGFEKSVSSPKETRDDRSDREYGEQPSDNCGFLCAVLDVLINSGQDDYAVERRPTSDRIQHDLDSYDETTELSEASKQAAPIITPEHHRELQASKSKIAKEYEPKRDSNLDFYFNYAVAEDNINGLSGGMEFNFGMLYGLIEAEDLYQDEFRLAQRTLSLGTHLNLGYHNTFDIFLGLRSLYGDDRNTGLRAGLIWTIKPNSKVSFPIGISTTYYENNEVTDLDMQVRYLVNDSVFIQSGINFRTTEADVNSLAIFKVGLGIRL